MCTKKDYIRAVKLILAAAPEYKFALTTAFILFFQQDNPRFDHKRFGDACYPGAK